MDYRVILERDPGGIWLVRVPRVAGCHTYGRTIREAVARIREALSLFVDDTDRAILREEIRLTPGARAVLRRARAARGRAARQHDRAQQALRDAALELSRGEGLGLRDAGTLLGLSHQRVQQLMNGRKKDRLIVD